MNEKIEKLEKLLKVKTDRRAVVSADLEKAQAELDKAQAKYLDKPASGVDAMTTAQAKTTALQGSLRALQAEIDQTRDDLAAATVEAQRAAALASIESIAREANDTAAALVSAHQTAIDTLRDNSAEIIARTRSLHAQRDSFRSAVANLLGYVPALTMNPQRQTQEEAAKRDYDDAAKSLVQEIEKTVALDGLGLFNTYGDTLNLPVQPSSLSLPDAGIYTAPINQAVNITAEATR